MEMRKGMEIIKKNDGEGRQAGASDSDHTAKNVTREIFVFGACLRLHSHSGSKWPESDPPPPPTM